MGRAFRTQRFPRDARTRDGARAYGVVVGDDGAFDAAATEALRGRMRADRPVSDSPFNFGPDIETLRANCEAETGLPAPRQPRWVESLAEAAE